MTTLHPEFHQKLLAVYEGMSNGQQGPQLTPYDLEKYDTLLSKRHLLRLRLQGELGGPAPNDERDAIKTELQRIDNDLHCTLSDCMPDFHAVHDKWFGRYQARELYRADCAYGHWLRPFILFLGAFMAIGIFSLLAMMP